MIFANRNEFAEKHIKNKTLALVGPANTLLGKNLGNKIDSCDVVIRLNQSYEIPKENQSDYGKRLDILYNNFDLSYEDNIKIGRPTDLIELDIKTIVCPYPIIVPFNKTILTVLSFLLQTNLELRTMNIGEYLSIFRDLNSIKSSFPPEKYEEVERKYVRPNTGILAFSDLLKCKPKKIFVYGFSFYKTTYYAKYTNSDNEKNQTLHKQEPQLKYFKKLYNQNRDIVQVDSFLENLLV